MSAVAMAADCDAPSPAVMGVPATAPGLDAPRLMQASIAPGLGEHASDLSVAAVLERAREAACFRPVSVADGYQKRTEFDNSPYRYNMQAGNMNAAQFEAWMAERGIRIVRASEVVDPAAVPATVPTAVSD
jgi:hypothetical protein